MRTIRHEHIRDATSMVQDSKKGRGETAEMVRACDWRKARKVLRIYRETGEMTIKDKMGGCLQTRHGKYRTESG